VENRLCASYRSVLDIKLKSLMLVKKDILCIAIIKNWEDMWLNDFCLIVAQNNFHCISRETRCLAKSVKGRKSQVFNIFE